MNTPHQIGIDEVGRGPVAGPVAVAAFLIRDTLLSELDSFHLKLKDSKKLSAQKREAWYAAIEEWQRQGKCEYAVTMIGPRYIDKYGIAPAIRSCIAKALLKVEEKMCTRYGVCQSDHMIMLDGGLHAPAEYKYQETVIKGDEKVKCISLASIVAKVTRDRYMDKKDKEFPVYGFIDHKGYSTSAHMKAIKKHGLSPLHRKTFLNNLSQDK